MNKDIFWIAPIAAMGIGLFPMPYGYYFLSRLVVFVCAIYFAMQLNDQSDTTWVWIFGFLALLYNPFIPIHLGSKGLWVIVNIITVVMFLLKKDRI